MNEAPAPEFSKGDPEFTGDALLFLVLDLEATVARHRAGATPLGRHVVNLAEAALQRDTPVTTVVQPTVAK
jgi:hypothetical protein